MKRRHYIAVIMSEQKGPGEEQQHGIAVAEVRPELKPPDPYKVVLLNDDYTTMEFVVAVLIQIFHHAEREAIEIMLSVHQSGAGVAGIFPREVADTKAARVMAMARAHEFPLRCTVERA
jgi:ATP-dependent Clp protease adaptor protein ClpS